uniref:DNA 3'-5' helicase n=1 Tax=Ciona savignyi TaxID=51511 RepID=H2YTB2_CIOSA
KYRSVFSTIPCFNVVQSKVKVKVHLFLIDEVHLLNDETRGATMEAVVSRMKTVQSCMKSDDSGLRFVAVSATIPNTDDIAEWLGSAKQPALSFDMDESYRPVKLRKVVLGYPWSSNGSEFKFDINLNYKLGNVIHTYSEGKPTLVFDETATAVIMTREQSRSLYQNIVNGSQKIESSLHSHLIEHLNAEIVLLTICDVSVALEWIRSTFLYIRLLKNPTHYDTRLHELCTHNLSQLQSFNLISIDKDQRLIPNEPGRLMARYCLTFDTVKKFGSLTGNESLQEMVDVIAGCREFQEVNLRMNERTTLNKMNKDKNRVVIRFPMTGRIKTTQMKVNCLLQATMGCINIQDFALSQDVTRIFRNAVRVARCLVELLMLKDNFKSLYNATLLSKCIRARLWENSRYVTKQLTNIGATLSSALANAGVATFSRAHEMNPRELELIVNRHAPFGNHMHDAIKHLPKYEVQVEQ